MENTNIPSNPTSGKKSKKGLGITIVIVVVLILAAAIWQAGPLLNKITSNGQNENASSLEFTINKGIDSSAETFFLNSIDKRISNFNLDLEDVTASVTDSETLVITLPENLPESFSQDDFVNYILNTPVFELYIENDPTTVVLTEEEQKEMDDYNAAALAKAEDILTQVLADPDSFSSLATEYSEDEGSKANGGAYSGVTKDQFVPEYDDVIFNKIAVGEIYNELVKSDYGYHIIKKDAETGEGDDRAIDTSHILIKTVNEEEYLSPKRWSDSELSGIYLDRVEYTVGDEGLSLQFTLNEEGKNIFAEITGNIIGRMIALLFDGAPLVTPTIDRQITGGNIVVSGDYPEEGVKLFVDRFNTGAIHSPLSFVE